MKKYQLQCETCGSTFPAAENTISCPQCGGHDLRTVMEAEAAKPARRESGAADKNKTA